MNDEIDIATTGIHREVSLSVAECRDAAKLQDAEISQSLRERAEGLVENRQLRFSGLAMRAFAKHGVILPLEERLAADQALLESLQCAPEMIAELRAE